MISRLAYKCSSLSGTTLVGDISSGGDSAIILETSILRAVVFFEVLGLSEKRMVQALDARRNWSQAALFWGLMSFGR